MDTLPMPLDALDALSARPGGLADFRITSAREIHATLRQFQDGAVRLHLNGRTGQSMAVTVWSVEDETLGLSIDLNVGAADPALAALLGADVVVAVACVDNVKVQFEVRAMVLVHSPRASVLRCACPREMYRFQRRSAFRVRPLPRSAPLARLRHPAQANATANGAAKTTATAQGEAALALRVLDVSIGGCALFLPANVPAWAAGSVIRDVELTLDADTRFRADLRLQHATVLNVESNGARLGCEFVNADALALRVLQRFIDQTQKRSRMLAIQ
jgi:flagellar brake protein